MSQFTHLNLLEVEDPAKKFGFDEHQEARFCNEATETEQTGFSLHRVKPGRRPATMAWRSSPSARAATTTAGRSCRAGGRTERALSSAGPGGLAGP